jgi:hypothetical protein
MQGNLHGGIMRSWTRAIGLITLSIAALGNGIAVAADANPFVGRWQWDGPETCARSYDIDNVALQITPGRLIFYENSCAIGSMHRLGEGSYRLRLTCRGEGEVERTETILALLKKSKVNDELLLRIEPASGFVLAYRRCP